MINTSGVLWVGPVGGVQYSYSYIYIDICIDSAVFYILLLYNSIASYFVCTYNVNYLLYCADRLKISVREFIARSGRISPEHHCQVIKICNIPIQYFVYVQYVSAQKYVWNTMISPSGIRLPHISPMQNFALYTSKIYMCCRKKRRLQFKNDKFIAPKGDVFVFSFCHLFEYLIYLL